MNLVDRLHGGYVHQRRIHVLGDHIVRLLPPDARVLDVGCGDGLLAHWIRQKRPDIEVSGIDVLVRNGTHIPVETFDGNTIPYEDASLDVVIFVDMLHHMEDPMVLLREGVRTARKSIVIKDHLLNGLWAGPTLRFMDRVGNMRHGVKLPYNYWSKQRWTEACKMLNVKIGAWTTDIELYP